MGKRCARVSRVFAPLCRCLTNVVIEARSFQKSGCNQVQHTLWKSYLSKPPAALSLVSLSWASHNILWSCARTWLCLTIQLYGLLFSQQQCIYIATYWVSGVQNKLVTIYMNYCKSGASFIAFVSKATSAQQLFQDTLLWYCKEQLNSLKRENIVILKVNLTHLSIS